MRRHALLAALVLLTALAGNALAGLKVYYLRHAESGVNARWRWKDKPKESWPAYVGNADAFSPEGEAQLKLVPAKLAAYRFDFIAVSPTWRTRQTILAYLREQKRQAELWPELTELNFLVDWMPVPADSPDAVRPDLWAGARPLAIAREEAYCFRLRGDQVGKVELHAKTRGDARAMVGRVVEMIRERFGGRDASILLVGHSAAGTSLLQALTERKAPEGCKNTRLWMVEEQPDRSFRLMILNDRPYVPTE